MERLSALEASHQIVDSRFPQAIAAFLAGSALTAYATPNSDLDIVVVLDGPPAPFRETIHEYGWPVELFVQTEESIDYFSNLEAANYKGTTLKMLTDGQILRSANRQAEKIKLAASERFHAGPPPVPEFEMRGRRYALTDQLDDLIGAIDPNEILYITQQLLVGCSELALLSKSQWLGTGKWLARSLEASDSQLSHRLFDAAKSVLLDGEKETMETLVREILGRVGGQLTVGYKVEGQILG